MLGLTLSLAAPLVLAAMGGWWSERSGIINIGLEGLMLTAACVTALAIPALGPYLGVGAGVLSAVLLSLLHWMATQRFAVDQIISGMAINALALGGTNFLYNQFTNPDTTSMVAHPPMLLFKIVAYSSPFLLWSYARWTRGGLRLLATGNDPEKARLAGIRPVMLRFFALMVTGAFAGLGGAMLLSNTGVFTDNMTAGKGYIALAALILGGWRPLPTLGACVAFGFFSALGLQFQGQPVLGLHLPNELWASLPYLATVTALAGFLGRQGTPAGLGKL